METTLQALLEQSKDTHLEVCTIISLLRKQGESETGYKLVSLKDYRRLSLAVSKLDKKIRAVTVERTKEILARNSQKRRNKA